MRRISKVIGACITAGASSTAAVALWKSHSSSNHIVYAEEPRNNDSDRPLKAFVGFEPSSLYGWGHALHLLGAGPKKINTPTKIAAAPKIQSVALSTDSAAYIDSEGRLFHTKLRTSQDVLSGATHLAPDAKFSQVALGTDGFLVALAKNGYVYYRSSDSEPLQRLDSGDIRRKTVTKISAGDKHAALVCSDGTAWTIGDNYTGAAGQPYSEKNRYITQPTQIKFEDSFVDVSCGKSHTVAVTKSGRVVSMGLNRYCQTGHRHTFAEGSDAQPMAPPYIVFGETRKTMQQNVEHRKQFMQEIRKDDPTVLSLYQPKPIKFFDDQKIQARKVVCGDDFTFVIASDGSVYNFGRGDMWALGTGRLKHINMPRLLDKAPFGAGASRDSLKELSCGSSHCLALMKTGDLYSWGWNADSGATGLGNFHVTKVPTPIAFKSNVSSVHCGGDSSVVITK